MKHDQCGIRNCKRRSRNNYLITKIWFRFLSMIRLNSRGFLPFVNLYISRLVAKGYM
uniref:Uncharacterized protein n=1 Tax=Rhizophora mucronata TaxID=61149 RepID=A0A2P2JF70_RHIMU